MLSGIGIGASHSTRRRRPADKRARCLLRQEGPAHTAPVFWVSSVEVFHSVRAPQLDIVRVRGLAAPKGGNRANWFRSPRAFLPMAFSILAFVAAAPERQHYSVGVPGHRGRLRIEPGHPFKGVRVHGGRQPRLSCQLSPDAEAMAAQRLHRLRWQVPAPQRSSGSGATTPRTALCAKRSSRKTRVSCVTRRALAPRLRPKPHDTGPQLIRARSCCPLGLSPQLSICALFATRKETINETHFIFFVVLIAVSCAMAVRASPVSRRSIPSRHAALASAQQSIVQAFRQHQRSPTEQ